MPTRSFTLPGSAKQMDFNLFYRHLRVLGITPEHIQTVPGGLYVLMDPYSLMVEIGPGPVIDCLPLFVRL